MRKRISIDDVGCPENGCRIASYFFWFWNFYVPHSIGDVNACVEFPRYKLDLFRLVALKTNVQVQRIAGKNKLHLLLSVEEEEKKLGNRIMNGDGRLGQN